jgi:hypothetical protein
MHIGLLPVRYEHHLDIQDYSYSRSRQSMHIGVLPVRYEHHLHIKSKAISVAGR